MGIDGLTKPKHKIVLFDESDTRLSVHELYVAQDTPTQASPKPLLNGNDPHHSSTNATARPAGYSVDRLARTRRRFIAGDAFYNHGAFGSLRPEFAPIQLFSSEFLGLAINALASGFVVTLLRNGYRQMLGEYMRLYTDANFVSSLQFLLEWAGCFSLFIGFLSDCRPIRGLRRKPYMIIGWVFACISFLGIVIVDASFAKSWGLLDWQGTAVDPDITRRATKYGGWLVAFTLLATVGVQINYIAALSMTVEFAQRETLLERGKLQALYFILYYAGAAIAQVVTMATVLGNEDDHVRSKLSVGMVALILGAVCVVAVPFLVGYLNEPSIATNTVHFSLRRRVYDLWRFLHQNVTVRILLFISIHYFLIGMYNKNARSAISAWCNITQAKQPTVNAIDTGFFVVSLTYWMTFMANWSWRRIAGIGSVVYISCYVFFTVVTVFDVVRNDWFYAVYLGALDIPKAWIKLYAIVLATEIADNGREGVAMGLVYVAQLMVGMCAHMLSGAVGKWLPFYVSTDDVVADSFVTRWQVFGGSAVMFAVNFLSLLLVLLLPNQKLDAQQLRAFGGFNRYASFVVLAIFMVIFSASFVMNTLALTKT